jgi:hypothetical protein
VHFLRNLLSLVPKDGQGMGMGSSPRLQLTRVIYRLIKRIEDSAERTAAVGSALAAIDTLSARLELVRTVGNQENVWHDLVPEPPRLSSRLQLLRGWSHGQHIKEISS